MFDLTRMLKYLVEGVVIMVAAHLLQGKKLKLRELLMLGVTAAVVHLMLDEFAPSVGSAARAGAGLSLGFHTVGGRGGGIPIVEGYCGDEDEEYH